MRETNKIDEYLGKKGGASRQANGMAYDSLRMPPRKL